MSKRVSLRDNEVEALMTLLGKEINELNDSLGKMFKRATDEIVSATFLNAFEDGSKELRVFYSIADKLKNAEERLK